MVVFIIQMTLLLLLFNNVLSLEDSLLFEKLNPKSSRNKTFYNVDGSDQSKSTEKNLFDFSESQILINPSFHRIAYYLPKVSNGVSHNCKEDLIALEEAFTNPELLYKEKRWALLMVDSWGKFEDGVLQGNRHFFGFFDECLNVKIYGSMSNSKGRYCLMSYGREPSDSMSTMMFPSMNISFDSYYATCIPSSCTRKELMDSVSKEMREEGLILHNAQCQSTTDDISYDASEFFGIIFFSAIAFLLLSASITDLVLDYCGKETLKQKGSVSLLLAFSVPSNMRKIFHIETNTDPNIITCIHGMRFLTISWIILDHQSYYTMRVSSNDAYIRMSQGFLVQIISNGDKAVDTFFMISGLLVSYNFFKNSYKPRKFSTIKFYLLRLLRLTPPIMICVIFFSTVAGLIPSGPLAPMYKDNRVDACQTYWWLDWTYMNNYVVRYGENLIEKTGEVYSCIPQCWYVSVDTQLYLVMPFFILLILRTKEIGFYILGAATALSFIIPAAIIGFHEAYPSTLLSYNMEKIIQYDHLIYMMPYCRASPYFVGVWAGYLIWKNTQKEIILSALQVAFGWTTAFLVMMVIIFGLYPYNYLDISNPADSISRWYAIFYGGLQRGLWGICIAWIIIACQWGHGGIVNSILSHPGLQPLSRLTYCISLISLPVQFLIIYSTVRPTYYSMLTKIQETCGIVFFSGCGGLLLSLMSEAPVLSLQKKLK